MSWSRFKRMSCIPQLCTGWTTECWFQKLLEISGLWVAHQKCFHLCIWGTSKCVLELTQNKPYQQLLKTVMQALKSAQNPSNSTCWSTHFDGQPTGTQEFNQYNQQPLVWTTEFYTVENSNNYIPLIDTHWIWIFMMSQPTEFPFIMTFTLQFEGYVSNLPAMWRANVQRQKLKDLVFKFQGSCKH